jgi:release factor glutamine methyltransferase
MVTIQTALQQGRGLLEESSVPVPRLTAEVLLAHVLGREKSYLYSHPEAELDGVASERYHCCLRDRIEGKPTQYITGIQEFYGRDFTVTPDVLIPRPETEHAVEAALALAPPPGRAVDVGCGSGAIAVSLSLELCATVFATDVSKAALAVAAVNARRLRARVEFVACDLAAAFSAGSLDLVISNPPYVALEDAQGLQREVRDFEPHVALFAGPTGLEVYERLVAEAARVLRPGGRLILELGFKTSDPVKSMLGKDWKEVSVLPDLAGIPRVLEARRG